MQLRPLSVPDLDLLRDIDATVESMRYLHVEQTGEGLAVGWRIVERPLREKRIEPNPVSEDLAFSARQIASGFDEGLALVTERDGVLLAALVAVPDISRKTLRLLDVRVDYDYRREGMGTAMGYMLLQAAREKQLRAVAAESLSDNPAAATFLLKLGFKLAGVDTLRQTNHDLVKERATLLWYATLD